MDSPGNICSTIVVLSTAVTKVHPSWVKLLTRTLECINSEYFIFDVTKAQRATKDFRSCKKIERVKKVKLKEHLSQVCSG